MGLSSSASSFVAHTQNRRLLLSLFAQLATICCSLLLSATVGLMPPSRVATVKKNINQSIKLTAVAAEREKERERERGGGEKKRRGSVEETSIKFTSTR